MGVAEEAGRRLRNLAVLFDVPASGPDRTNQAQWENGLCDLFDGNAFVRLEACHPLELRHRIWRAQVAVLFGWLEEIRLAFVERIAPALQNSSADPSNWEWSELSQRLHESVPREHQQFGALSSSAKSLGTPASCRAGRLRRRSSTSRTIGFNCETLIHSSFFNTPATKNATYCLSPGVGSLITRKPTRRSPSGCCTRSLAAAATLGANTHDVDVVLESECCALTTLLYLAAHYRPDCADDAVAAFNPKHVAVIEEKAQTIDAIMHSLESRMSTRTSGSYKFEPIRVLIRK
jgi:hypothetical protein